MTVAEVIADHQLLQGRNEDYRGRIISEAWVCACGTRFKHSGQEGYKAQRGHIVRDNPYRTA